MGYDVRLSENAIKSLKRIDYYQGQIIIAWIEKNLQDCDNPRLYGKPLVGDKRGYWCYRVGSYRIMADIRDSVIMINIVNVGHRREVYE